jgi:hypothetical protein
MFSLDRQDSGEAHLAAALHEPEHQNHDALMAVTKPDAGLFLLRVEKKSIGIFSRGDSLSISVDQVSELGTVSAVLVL